VVKIEIASEDFFGGCASEEIMKRSGEMPSTKRKLTAPAPHRGYDDAFDSFINDLAIELKEVARAAREILQVSSSFNDITDLLNKEYVSGERLESLGGTEKFEPDDDGVLKKSPFAGRRSLVFSNLHIKLTLGDRFLSVGSFQTQSTAFSDNDFIVVTFPMAVVKEQRGKVIARLVGTIAHETVHAFHRVTIPTKTSLSRAQRANAFIEEEIATRKKEKDILRQIVSAGGVTALAVAEKKDKGLKQEIENRIDQIILSRPEVERDFVSGTRLTYLETFVMEDMINQSLRVKELDSGKIREDFDAVNELVFDTSLDEVLKVKHPELLTRDPKTGLKTPFLETEFKELLLARRAMESHWKEHQADNLEPILELHKHAFFPEGIDYTSRPKTGPAKQTKQPKARVPAKSRAPEEPFSSRILRSETGLVLVPTPTAKPTPGKFYQIKSGDSLFGISKKAYNSGSMEAARRINDSQYNRRFRKSAPESERKMFPDGRISFNPRFVGDLRAQMESEATASAGSSFAMIWIPGEDGGEPF